MIITIDGPVAAGKGLLASSLAKKLGFLYIDSGAIFRSVAYFCLTNGINTEDEKSVSEALKLISRYKQVFDEGSNKNKFFLNGIDISEKIRTPEISALSSMISEFNSVREFAKNIQRKMAKNQNVIVEGRDTGSVIFPNADLKIYLECDLKIRAKRRLADYLEKEIKKTYEEVLKETEERDNRDLTRKIAPLTKPEDAVVIDTTNMTLDEEIEKIIDLIKKRGLKN